MFSYPSSLLNKLEKNLPEEHNMMPYGYSSYDEYYSEMDRIAEEYFQDSDLSDMYHRFTEIMHQKNVKENWSVLRYVGETDNHLFGLTNGHIYYWPCSLEEPIYEGVIDDEEFTSYWFSTEACDWEILEDPTGMAYRTIYKKATGYPDRKQCISVINQLKKLENT